LSSLQPIQVLLASSNPGKLREYRVLAGDSPIELALLPNFSEIRLSTKPRQPSPRTPRKSRYYSRFATGTVLADDSGLVVPVLGGAPGVFSARYAGPEQVMLIECRSCYGK
jgi:XTP/dITP diphosphohydrolase